MDKETRVNKRDDSILNYEKINLKNKKRKNTDVGSLSFLFELNYDNRIGFYDADQISNFKECTVKKKIIFQRLMKIISKTGRFITAKDAIVEPIVKANGESIYNKRVMKKLLYQETEMDWFNNSMKLFHKGSLSWSVR